MPPDAQVRIALLKIFSVDAVQAVGPPNRDRAAGLRALTTRQRIGIQIVNIGDFRVSHELCRTSSSARPRQSRRYKRLWSAARRWSAGMSGTCLSALLGRRWSEAFGILMYHRVGPWTGANPPPWNVTPQRFNDQLAGLLARGYEPWTLRRALASSKNGWRIPRNAFIVTFDDGYENVHTWALPILRKLRIPATVFVATAYLNSDSPFPFDDWPLAGSPAVAAELWRPLSEAQCREALQSGLIELGSHTHTHRLTGSGGEEFRADLRQSLAVLQSRFGLSNPTFSFPFGIAGPERAAIVRNERLLCGLTTRGEVVTPDRDPFGWGRLAVEQVDTARTIAAQLDGWCHLSRKSWQRLERLTMKAAVA
jgi:peptidoglycan/xylan/chitin deacetylase (PgdA/CDA1 family)